MTTMPAVPAKDNAKLLRVIGFVLFLFSNFLTSLESAASVPLPAFFYKIFKSIGIFDNIGCILKFSGLLVAAIGFFIAFSNKKEDKSALLVGITLTLAAAMSVLSLMYVLPFSLVLSYLFVITLAVRTLRYNRTIGVLLIFAFVYQFVAKGIFYIFILNSRITSVAGYLFFLLLSALGDIACAVMALLSCVLEKDMTPVSEVPAKDNAKIIRIVGLALFLFSKFLWLLSTFRQIPDYPVGSWFWALSLFPSPYDRVIGFIQIIGLVLAAVGFFITFLKKKEDKTTLFAGITFALAVVLSVLPFPPILHQFLFYLFLIALAVRTLRYNRAIGVLLILAFVYQSVVHLILVSALYSSSQLYYAASLHTALGNTVCAVIALLSGVLEKDKSTAKPPIPDSFG